MKLTPFELQKHKEYTARYPELADRGKRWVGFDFDGTLATDVEINHKTEMHLVGEPIHAMIKRVNFWLGAGFNAKIFTARMSHPDKYIKDEVSKAMQKFCNDNGIPELEIVCAKDHRMFLFYDDRAINPLHSLKDERAWQQDAEAGVAAETPEEVLPMDSIDCLQKALETVRHRKEVYGNNHLSFGPLMELLLPQLGISCDQWNKIGVVTQLVAKLSRYCNSNMTHIDSAHDGIGYNAILEELTRNSK